MFFVKIEFLRNRLFVENIKKVVFINGNRRLVESIRSLGYQEATIEWEEWGQISEDDD